MRIRKNLRAVFLAFFCALILIYSLISLFKIIYTKAPDFEIFYYSTLDFLKGINPYTDKTLFTIYNYPPETNLVYLPLLLFNFRAAQTIYILLSYLSVFLIVFFSLKIIKKNFSLSDYWVITSLVLLSFPTKFTLGMGQANLLAYLSLIISYYSFTKNRTVLSGLFLGISVVLKPIFIFIFCFYSFKKAYKTIFSSLFLILILALIVVFLRPNFHIFYLKSLLGNVFSFRGTEIYYNQGVLAFVSRLTKDIILRKIFYYLSSFILLISASIFLLKNRSQNFQFSLILTLLPIINIMSWQHHFVILIFPFIFAFHLLNKNKIQTTLLILAYLLVSFNIRNPVHDSFVSSLILSHQFFGAILLYLFLLSRKNNIST